ncbi:MAG: PIN domain-containing protein [Gracilibacteraceae bacterium]|nr:PIN domain-containing protein [Gracilibacteraceae bacterium]
MQTLLAASREWLKLTPQIEKQAALFQEHGLKPFDSLHLALAESYGLDVFLTTDDRLMRSAKKLDIKTIVSNPVSWLMEVKKDER